MVEQSVIQINGGITMCRCEYKKINVYEKDYVWNPSKCIFGNGNYLASIADKIICDEIIDMKETNFNEKI